jgi:hypothetical protein
LDDWGELGLSFLVSWDETERTDVADGDEDADEAYEA